MVISSPVKKSKEIKEIDRLNLWDWFDKQIILNPSAKTSLNDCYETYKYYLEFHQQVVALSKKTFSGLFRELLQEDENKGKIRFYQRSSILIKGIEIKDVEVNNICSLNETNLLEKNMESIARDTQ